MKVYLLVFANAAFTESARKLIASAKKFGMENILFYTDKDIVKTDFFVQNRELLTEPKGAGLWLWKPYLINQTLLNLSDGDLLFYCDAGSEFISDPAPLFKICNESKNGILLFRNDGHINRCWTKRDCFVLMNCDSEPYWEGRQVAAGFQLYIKNKKSMDFVSEYLFFCKNKNILSEAPNICGLPNFPEFREHRHDQSVLSLLSIKYDIELFREPSQNGDYLKPPPARIEHELDNHPYYREYTVHPMLNSPYSTIINNHKRRVRRLIDYLSLLKKLKSPTRVIKKIREDPMYFKKLIYSIFSK